MEKAYENCMDLSDLSFQSCLENDPVPLLEDHFRWGAYPALEKSLQKGKVSDVSTVNEGSLGIGIA